MWAKQACCHLRGRGGRQGQLEGLAVNALIEGTDVLFVSTAGNPSLGHEFAANSLPSCNQPLLSEAAETDGALMVLRKKGRWKTRGPSA